MNGVDAVVDPVPSATMVSASCWRIARTAVTGEVNLAPYLDLVEPAERPTGGFDPTPLPLLYLATLGAAGLTVFTDFLTAGTFLLAIVLSPLLHSSLSAAA